MLTSSTPEVTAWSRDALTEFDRRRDDIMIMERAPLPGLANVVAAAQIHTFRTFVTAENADVRAAEGLAALRLDCAALAEDIAALARSFLAQFESVEASLRVEVVTQASCPKFHCDNVRVRLVTTYYGPGTEYVRTDAPDRVHVAPPFALVFLKGHKHPTHADRVHHRSPAVPPGGKRLCVVLDL